MMHPDNVRFWRSVVALNADDGVDVARARADLEDLARTTRVTGLAEAARRHAVADAPAAGAHPTGQRSFESQSSESLSPESHAVVDDIEARLAREADTARANVRRSPVTLALIAANLAAFAAEIWFGGSQSSEALITLGALWPPLVVEAGKWWRLIAAPFLHFGPVHLAANMFVLSLLGPLCESAFGRLPMLFAYMGGALLSNTAVLVMMIEGWTGYGVLVGASGAIFTLFGLLFVRRARLWLASRDVLDRQPILILLLALALQFAIDLTLPEVSLAAHASGFLAGVLASLILPGREPLPARVP
jgi:rhomboid protease GluP